MKQLILISALALPFLSSCDHIDKVGDKVNELKDVRKESTQGVDGMDLKAIVSGAQNAGPAIQDIGEVDYQSFISKPGRLNVVVFRINDSKPCKDLDPIISSVIEAHSNIVRLGKLDVDQARELALEQKVESVPDVRIFIDGKQVDQFNGAVTREAIETLITTHAAKINPAAGMIPGITEANGAAIPTKPRPPGAKPIEEAMKPMEKNWLPPGVSQKK